MAGVPTVIGTAVTAVGTTLQSALGGLIGRLFEKLFAFIAGYLGVKWATRLTAATIMATAYVACVVTFTTMIGPWFAALISTSYGYLLGLLFPPVAGTVIASLMTYRMCVIGIRYTGKLFKMVVS